MTVGGGTLERWRSEKTAAYLATAVAAAESDPGNAKLFRNMAGAAEKQAGILAKDLGRTPDFSPALRARLIAKCIAAFGPRAMRHVLSAAKVRGVSVYDGTTEAPSGHPWPTSVEDIGKRHRSFGGGTLRAGVFGVNDGLVSNTCLVMGVAGAAVEPGVIVLTGVAGLLAGAFSMAAGEFISMLSQREMFEHQISQEREELERYPKEEAEELWSQWLSEMRRTAELGLGYAPPIRPRRKDHDPKLAKLVQERNAIRKRRDRATAEERALAQSELREAQKKVRVRAAATRTLAAQRRDNVMLKCNSRNPSIYWDLLKKTVGLQRKKVALPGEVIFKGVVASGDAILEVWREAFQKLSAVDREEKSFRVQFLEEIQQEVRAESAISQQFDSLNSELNQPIMCEEVLEVITKLNQGKAAGNAGSSQRRAIHAE